MLLSLEKGEILINQIRGMDGLVGLKDLGCHFMITVKSGFTFKMTALYEVG